MAHISREEVQRVTSEFRKMAELADGLENMGDNNAALAVRVALYDRVQDTILQVEADIQSYGMTRSASDGMERESAAPAWLSAIGKGLKGVGKGLWNAIRGQGMTPGANTVINKAIRNPDKGLLEKGLNWAAGGGKLGGGPLLTRAPGAMAYKATPLGRGVAIGGAALGAGALGAGALRGGRGPEQKPTGPGNIPYPTQPPGGSAGGPSGGPQTQAGWPMGGGNQEGWGNYGGGPGSGMGGPGSGMGGGGNAAAAMQQLQGLSSKVQELDGRVARLEGGGVR